MKVMSNDFGIYNRVFNSILEATEKNSFEEAYKIVKEADCIVGTSSGRSERTLDVTSGEYRRNSDKVYINSNDPGFPGDTFDKAAPELERYYKKLVGVFVSSGGETLSTNDSLKQLSSYLEKSKSNKWEILLLTQNTNSTAGKILKENNGIIVETKGSENKDSKNYREYGMQRDWGEYSSLWTLQTLYQALVEGATHERVPEIIENKLPEFGGRIDKWEGSKTCESLMENLGRHSDVFAGGRRGGKEVSKFLIKRIDQVKGIVEDRGYLIEGVSPDPREGDILILPSKSGGKIGFYSEELKREAYVVSWCKKAQEEMGAIVYAFVGTKNSPLEDLCGCNYTVIVDSATKGFSDTYAKIMTFQGILPIKLAERLDERGYDVSPKNLKKRHGF